MESMKGCTELGNQTMATTTSPTTVEVKYLFHGYTYIYVFISVFV